jgi:hypothetical protein
LKVQVTVNMRFIAALAAISFLIGCASADHIALTNGAGDPANPLAVESPVPAASNTLATSRASREDHEPAAMPGMMDHSMMMHHDHKAASQPATTQGPAAHDLGKGAAQ